MAQNTRFRQLPVTCALSRFFSWYDDGERSGFITRLDRSSVSMKIATFIKAFILNILILVFIICVMTASFMHEFAHLEAMPLYSRIIAWTAQNILVAGAITILLRSTSVPFFLGECRLRIIYGVRPSEIIILRAPPYTATMSSKSKGPATEDQRVEHQWRSAIRAIDPRLFYSAATALLSHEYWTVEYTALFDVLRRISKGEIEQDDLEFSIWRQTPGNIWTVCELWRMHEIMSDQQEVTMFKSFLTRSGKQALVDIWEKMACSDKGRGFERASSNPKSYQTMVDQFAREGLDYETVWSKISDRTLMSEHAL